MLNGMTYPQCGHARYDMGKNITTDAAGLRPTSGWSSLLFCGAAVATDAAAPTLRQPYGALRTWLDLQLAPPSHD
jgi:hypothetical protein